MLPCFSADAPLGTDGSHTFHPHSEIPPVRLETIIAGVDGSRQSLHAATLAYRLAEALGGTYHLVHAAAEVRAPTDILGIAAGEPTPTQHIKHEARRKIRTKLRGVIPADQLDRLQVEVGRAPKVLADAVRRREADLVIVGAKRRSTLTRAVVGSVVPYLLRSLDVPVLLATPADEVPKRILVSVDLSGVTHATLEYAVQLARLLGATVRAVHVVEPDVLPPALPVTIEPEEFSRRSRDVFVERLKEFEAQGRIERAVRHGKAAEEIADEALAWGADLIVMGSHGHGKLYRKVMGSVCESVLDSRLVPVLVIPESREKEER